MSNEQLIVDTLRSIQLRLNATEHAVNIVRSEVQHLGRRLDNLLGSSLYRLHGAQNTAGDTATVLRALVNRLDTIEGSLSAPAARRAPAKKAAAKKVGARKAAAKRGPAKTAKKAAKKAAPKKAAKAARKSAKRPAKGRR